MNVISFLTSSYGNFCLRCPIKNKANQTQFKAKTNPIKPKLETTSSRTVALKPITNNALIPPCFVIDKLQNFYIITRSQAKMFLQLLINKRFGSAARGLSLRLENHRLNLTEQLTFQ